MPAMPFDPPRTSSLRLGAEAIAPMGRSYEGERREEGVAGILAGPVS